MTQSVSSSNQLPTQTKYVILLISLLQGIGLLCVNQLLENKLWPTDSITGIFLLYTLLIAVPLSINMLITKIKDRLLWTTLLSYTVLLLILSAYSGSQLELPAKASFETNIFPYIATIAITWFILMFFIQTWISNKDLSLPYTELFNHSWNNYLTLKLAVVFVGIFSGILTLWAGLFLILDINFFSKTFSSKWFAYPVYTVAAGFGILLFRTQVNAVETLRKILRTLMRFLLPILSLIALLFLTTLPFTGLELLWKTGYGTFLMLWLVALVLFFTNAVYQDGEGENPYNIYITRFLQTALILLPLYVAFGFYGLSIRVNQYGWTIERLWGMTVIFILAGFSISYAISIITSHKFWLEKLKISNKIMAAVIALICILVNSPLLDFKKISVNNQLSRLDDKIIPVEKFDYQYFYHHLGKPGYIALTNLKQHDLVADKPEIISKIEDALSSNYYHHTDSRPPREELVNLIDIYPKNSKPPTELLDKVYTNFETGSSRSIDNEKSFLIEIDLNDDTLPEYLFIKPMSSWADITLYHLTEKEWTSSNQNNLYQTWKHDEIIEALNDGNFHSKAPVWNNLYIGDQKITIK